MTHVKSLTAPRYIPKKPTVFTVSPRPGPHPKRRSIPLMIVVRDLLKLADEAKVAKKLIKEGKFLVDGRVVKDPRFPLGLMDVLSIPTLSEHYRVLIKPGKGLVISKIPQEEAVFKICQVVTKNHVKGGALMIGLHDGKTILFRGDMVDKGRQIKILDSVKISLPQQEILDVANLGADVYVYVTKGARAGLHGKVVKIRREAVFPDKPTATIQTSTGTVTTLLQNMMPVGGETPWITLL